MKLQLQHALALLALSAESEWRVLHAETCLALEPGPVLDDLELSGLLRWESIEEVDILDVRAGVQVARLTDKGKRIASALVDRMQSRAIDA